MRGVMDHIKNLGGWRTRRKLVVIAVDDYGNVRLDSRQAREALNKAGFMAKNRFDRFDTLETVQDLEALYEVLSSVEDRNGRNAIFSPYALPCNINYEVMADEGYQRYVHEDLPVTFQKLEARHPRAYSGAWTMWKEGMEMGLMAPQCHGREHVNLGIMKEKIARGDADLYAAFRNRSYTGLTVPPGRSFGYSAAFGFKDTEELKGHEQILEHGLRAFKHVFGYHSVCFTAPAQQFHPDLEPVLRRNGILALDRPFMHVQQSPGTGRNNSQSQRKWSTTARKWNTTGALRSSGLRTMVRNVVFEPCDGKHVIPDAINEAVSTASESVERALKEIAVAFRLGKPAIISSHRVNYCGFVEESNRRIGLASLKSLLRELVHRWPDVEFMSVAELTDLICSDPKKGEKP